MEYLPSSSPKLVDILAEIEEFLSGVQESPSESVKNQITKGMIANQLVKHPNLDVNISVSCCICEILRIRAPIIPYNDEEMKDIFEMVTMTFEKLSSVAGGCYDKMIKVLKSFSSLKLSVLMLKLQLNELVVRLFRQFLTVADSNSAAVVLEIEKIMTMIIEESQQPNLDLVRLLITSVRKDNQVASPVCCQLGEKVLKKCAAKLKPYLLDTCIAFQDYSKILSSICNSKSENEPKVPPKKQVISTDDKTIQSKSETEVKGKKRKRSYDPPKKQGEDLVGSWIRIFWPEDGCYYFGVVDSFDNKTKKHKMCYTEGDVEILNLKKQRWELVENVKLTDGKTIQSRSEAEVKGKKRKRSYDPPKKQGEDLVGSWIRIYWPEDKSYNFGIVKSFDNKTKKHKVCYTEGDAKILNLKKQRWELFENVADELPRDASSSQIQSVELISVHGYNVKHSIAPLLDSIFAKHGDIASECIFKTPSVRASLLELVCEIVSQFQTAEVTTIISQMEKIENQISEAESAKINVSWLRVHFEAFYKKKELGKKFRLITETKAKTELVKRAAETDLKESYIEFLAAREKLEKAERCMKVLNLVEKKVDDNILEAKVEEESWEKPIIV